MGLRSKAGSVKRSLLYMWRRALYRIVFGRFESLGKGAVISLKATILHPERIAIGKGTHISEYSLIGATANGHIVIGDNCWIGRFNAVQDAGGSIEIGQGVGTGQNCFITGQGGLRIGDYSLLAPMVSIVPNQHRFDDLATPITNQPETGVGITIGRNGWIGVGSTILDGVTVGDHVVIAANSVVTKDVPAYSIVGGTPARVLRSLIKEQSD